MTEFRIVGFSKECFEGVGGDLNEYTHCVLQLYTVRRSTYYLYKVAMPVLMCTIFCFSAAQGEERPPPPPRQLC